AQSISSSSWCSMFSTSHLPSFPTPRCTSPPLKRRTSPNSPNLSMQYSSTVSSSTSMKPMRRWRTKSLPGWIL
ncbi:hypothetical protein V8D89_006203, partial [Ganoderma adspersum]